MDDVIKSILEKISFQDDCNLVCDDSDEVISRLDKKNFYEIKKSKPLKSIVFIDGGNLELIRSPSLSVFFSRVVYIKYKDNKKTSSKRIEFYSVFHAKEDNGKITYCSEYFFLSEKLSFPKLSISSLDKSISLNGKRAELSILGNIARRLAELSLIKDISEKGSIVVLDGSLETRYPFEEETLKDSISALEKNDSILLGLSKTTNLLTKSGLPVSVFLERIAHNEEWAYICDALKESPIKMHFVKLNKNSKYIFRLDSYMAPEISDALFLLKENSKDPIFPGYPYGLIAADRLARVTNREKQQLTLRLMLRLGKDAKKLLPFLNSINAHSILDNIG